MSVRLTAISLAALSLEDVALERRAEERGDQRTFVCRRPGDVDAQRWQRDLLEVQAQADPRRDVSLGFG